MRHTITCLLLALLSGTGVTNVAAANPDKALSLGVFPYLPPARLEQLYAPVAANLSQAIGQPVQLRTRPDFRSFSEAIKQENYDLIFIQPFGYAKLAAQHGYRALARPRQRLNAIIVTPANSLLRSLNDLRGQILATPPQGAAVSILGLKMLAGQSLKPGRDLQLAPGKSHVACLRMALIGKAGACVTAPSPLSIFVQDSGIAFRVIAASESVPASTFAVHKRVSHALRNTLLRNILDWDKHPAGNKLLHDLHQTPFIPSYDEDYNTVRDILRTIQTFQSLPTTQHETITH